MAEPGRLSWPIQYGCLLEAINGNAIEPNGRVELLKMIDQAKVGI
jgi:hypothetical protein